MSRHAVTRYARANNIELCLHYNDGVGRDDFSPAIFPRKLANGACQPMYIAPGMDISGSHHEMLNKNMARPSFNRAAGIAQAQPVGSAGRWELFPARPPTIEFGSCSPRSTEGESGKFPAQGTRRT